MRFNWLFKDGDRGESDRRRGDSDSDTSSVDRVPSHDEIEQASSQSSEDEGRGGAYPSWGGKQKPPGNVTSPSEQFMSYILYVELIYCICMLYYKFSFDI